MKAADVVQVTVIGFAYHRIDTAHIFVALKSESIFQDPFDALCYGKCVGQYDRRLDIAEFADLRHAGEFAESVACVDCRRALLAENIAVMRDDGRNSGPNVITLYDRDMTDLDARDVGDRIELAGLEYSRCDSVIPDPSAL